MSGIEAIGLILRAIPLAISSLEQYKQGTSVFRFYRQARLEIEGIKAELEVQQIILLQTLEVLLYGTLPESELLELLSDRRSSKWQSEEVESGLKKSLGNDGYTIFMKSVSQLFDTVSSLEKSLRNITDGSKGNRFISRGSLRWALRKDKTRESLYDLEKQTYRLTHLVEYATSSKTFETTQAIGNINISLMKISEVQKVAQNVEDLTTGAIGTAQDADDDAQSTYSVESEVGRDDCFGRTFANAAI
jgi:hypothetical protein